MAKRGHKSRPRKRQPRSQENRQAREYRKFLAERERQPELSAEEAEQIRAAGLRTEVTVGGERDHVLSQAVGAAAYTHRRRRGK